MFRLLQILFISLLIHMPIDSIAMSFSESNKNACNEVLDKVRKGALLVDVRTKEEFQAGTISKDVVLYCKSGRRSELGKQTLSKLGYNNVINAGNYIELLKCWANN
jgi:rhodanese-related sulfurtransferase